MHRDALGAGRFGGSGLVHHRRGGRLEPAGDHRIDPRDSTLDRRERHDPPLSARRVPAMAHQRIHVLGDDRDRLVRLAERSGAREGDGDAAVRAGEAFGVMAAGIRAGLSPGSPELLIAPRDGVDTLSDSEIRDRMKLFLFSRRDVGTRLPGKARRSRVFGGPSADGGQRRFE